MCGMTYRLLSALILAALALTCAGCASRKVISRITVPGHSPAQVVFAQIGDDYRVEFPDGSYTKHWLGASETTAEEIRKNCRVEYDGQTLRILGPRQSDLLEVPGYRF
jgi:hypothetical protein